MLKSGITVLLLLSVSVFVDVVLKIQVVNFTTPVHAQFQAGIKFVEQQLPRAVLLGSCSSDKRASSHPPPPLKLPLHILVNQA
jgi:hypothetical protein